jgi:hypothetical protein
MVLLVSYELRRNHLRFEMRENCKDYATKTMGFTG